MFNATRKTFYGLLLLCAAVALLGGCSSGPSNMPENDESAAASGAATIVVTYFPYADHLFALGQADRLKGVVNLKSLQNFTVYDQFLQDGAVADLGDQVELEKIAALKPDLIIASPNEEQYMEQLSKIAKTVTVPATLNWKDTMTGVAAAIGEEAAAENYVAQFEKLQNETVAIMEKSGEKGKTALFTMPWKSAFTYWGSTRMSLYYDKLGFQPVDDLEMVGEITLEGIVALNPDYIFIGKDYTGSSEIKLDDLAGNPVWNTLDAVKNNKVFIVDTEILGPLAMGQYKGLEYMQKLLSDGQTS
jgi:iron complex transport system substrate-binding protein